MASSERHYDVVIVTDCRLPGGTVASVAEEIVAQHRGGYTTAIAHVDSHLVGYARPFNPRIARLVEQGAVDVLIGDAPVTARLVVVRHPAMLLAPGLRLPPIQADVRLVVANQTPTDDEGRHVYYDVAAVERVAHERLGGPPQWATIGPLVREQFQRHAPEIDLLDPDWVNIINVDAWAAPRTGPQGERPVIGRHSRDHRHKWPATRDEMLAAYPADPDIEVRVLGGAEQAARVLGRLPDNWRAYAFGSMPAERFLAGLDFFVYYHHPAWVEAFGRTILEAMASGAVPILPHHFQQLFGDAPLYSPPSGVGEIVRRLHADPEAFVERSEQAREFVREHFGHRTHQRRVERLIGPPSTSPQQQTSASTGHTVAGSSVGDDRARVLFMSSNGVGVGHLMRLMAMARRADDEILPLFLTLSQAVPVVRANGFFVEYLPSRGFTQMEFRDWHALLRDRLDDLIRTHDVQAVVFDGTYPYRGLLEATVDHPGVKFIWSRRGMWRSGLAAPQLETSDEFDLIVEPGEFAETFDHGPTADRRQEAVRVGPITFLDPEELLDRATARRELGLDPDRPAALVQLGAGNINDVDSLLGSVTERLVAEKELQVCVTSSIIADRAQGLESEVISIRGVYPLAKYFAAFDFAIAASGYNSYHEAIAYALPTVFIPNLETSADDQAGRSAYAQLAGVGLHVPTPDADTIDAAVRTMMDPDARAAMVAEARRRAPSNGAADAMRVIARALDIGPGPDPDRATGDLGEPPGQRPTDVEAAVGTRPSGAPTTSPAAAPGSAAPTPARPTAGTVATPEDRVTVAERLHRGRVRVRRLYRDTRARAARRVQTPEARALARRPFRALPRPAQAAIRRRLRRWERHAPITLRTRAVETALHLPVPPGALLPATETAEPLPGVLVILPEQVDEQEHQRLVERVASLQIVHRNFAPLVLTFSDDLAPYRRLGMALELVASREVWAQARPQEQWPMYLQERVSRLLETWDIRQIVSLGSVADLPAERLAALSLRNDQLSP